MSGRADGHHAGPDDSSHLERTVSNTRPHRVPAVTEVDRIAAIRDPTLRNLRITQCYHELSAALAQRSGPSANWCTFATWASRQAGQTIRKEDLAHKLESVLNTAPAPTQAVRGVAVSAQDIGARHDTEEIRKLVWDACGPWASLARSIAAVGRGNRRSLRRLDANLLASFRRLLFRRLLDRLAPFDAATNMLIATARQYTRAIITEHLMTIALPGGERLGSDLSGEFPASLKKITNPDLHALLERADPQQPARNRCARLGLPTGSSASYSGYVSLLSRAAGSTRATIHSRAGRRTECWSFARRPIVSV